MEGRTSRPCQREGGQGGRENGAKARRSDNQLNLHIPLMTVTIFITSEHLLFLSPAPLSRLKDAVPAHIRYVIVYHTSAML